MWLFPVCTILSQSNGGNQQAGVLVMTTIMGVDFSGARADRNTWLTRGRLEGENLKLEDCRPVSRYELTETLSSSSGKTIAALDFPFATPKAFADFWQPGSETMPQLWEAAASMEYEAFLALRDEFVDQWGEPKRACDPPESYSCLHMVNPIMVPMTFHGMTMLHRLWTGRTANAMAVPPLPMYSRDGIGEVTVLLEVMPGAVLRKLGLPYKGYKGGARALDRRKRVVEELPGRVSPVTFQFGAFEGLALRKHDALDSVVAAVAAALWEINPGEFPQPPAEGEPGFDPTTLLEGWLYAPEIS